MIIDPAQTPPQEIYRHLIACIVPRPIAWVSTLSASGAPNLAPFSYFTGVGLAPPSLCFSVLNKRDGAKKDTIRNIETVPEFVVNVVPDRLSAAMNISSAEYEYESDEFAHAGLAAAASERVRPARVAESPVAFECRLIQILRVGEGPFAANLVVGEIVLMHVDDAALGAAGTADPARLDLIGRMGGDSYARTRELFEIERPRRPR